MLEVGPTEEVAEDNINWKMTPKRERPKDYYYRFYYHHYCFTFIDIIVLSLLLSLISLIFYTNAVIGVNPILQEEVLTQERKGTRNWLTPGKLGKHEGP